jgi:beta-glucosidase
MRVRRAVTTALAASLSAIAVVSATGVQRAAGTGAVASVAATPIYQDPSYSFAERAADLVSRMSTAEKASQTISSVAPAIPRLGIQQYGWWNEALHGVSRLQYNNNANASTLQNTTSYPIDQSLGASWDPSLVYKVATAISDEAREVVPGNTLNLDFYSPTMNLERDPRWGRNDESDAEDPLLVTKLVDQFVNGIEGKATDGKLLPDGNGYKKLLTTIKHYAANNSEVNRRTGSSDMDDRTLREYYTKAFRGIVQDADPASVMSSYNRANGTPVSADPYMIDTLMRETFGVKGYMTSDCDAIYEIVAGHHWQPPDWTRPANNIERQRSRCPPARTPTARSASTTSTAT